MVWIQGILTELVNGIHINHILQFIIIPGLDLLDLVGCTETVKEVDKRNFALDSCHMGYYSQVHNFLYTGLAQHSTACLTTCVNIGVVTENR